MNVIVFPIPFVYITHSYELIYRMVEKRIFLAFGYTKQGFRILFTSMYNYGREALVKGCSAQTAPGVAV